jgi:hypothetical protein
MDDKQFDDIITEAFKRIKADEDKVIDIRRDEFEKRLKEALIKEGLLS